MPDFVPPTTVDSDLGQSRQTQPLSPTEKAQSYTHNPQGPRSFSGHPSDTHSRPEPQTFYTAQSFPQSARSYSGQQTYTQDPPQSHVQPRSQPRPHIQTAQLSRSDSIPNKSPLQKLEMTFGDITKEEKRARAEEAERRALRRSQKGAYGATSARLQQPARDGDRSISRKPVYTTAVRGIVVPAPRQQDLASPTQVSPQSQHASRFEGYAPTQSYQNTPSHDTYGPTRPAARTSHSARSSDSQYGHDAALTGGAAAAALGAYRTSHARQTMPRSHDSDVSSISGDDDHNGHGRQTGSPQHARQAISAQDRLLNKRLDTSNRNSTAYTEDPVRVDKFRNISAEGPAYAAGEGARERVNFGDSNAQQSGSYHNSANIFEDSDLGRRYQAQKSTGEWRNGGIASLSGTDADLNSAQRHAGRNAHSQSQKQDFGSSSRTSRAARKPLHNDSYPTSFRPPLVLKCGPLLRYTGMRKGSVTSRADFAEEVWRGSIMIVTEDRFSTYDSVPRLRLFRQTMSLLPFQPFEVGGVFGTDMAREHTDPVAGQVKVSRTGGCLFVRPATLLRSGVDLSRLETDQGLFERTRSAGDEAQSPSRFSEHDGEHLGLYREVDAVRLLAERGFTFWRFNIEVELTSEQMRIAYRINEGPAVGFWVPAKGQSMNIMLYTCNGFSMGATPDVFSGPDPLWRDVLNKHQSKPFHVMIGGGNQIFNDVVMKDTHHFQEWLRIKNNDHKHSAQFSVAMQDELEYFYLNRYAMWFSQGFFGMANSQIPMVNTWDDHEIISVSALFVFGILSADNH